MPVAAINDKSAFGSCVTCTSCHFCFFLRLHCALVCGCVHVCVCVYPYEYHEYLYGGLLVRRAKV